MRVAILLVLCLSLAGHSIGTEDANRGNSVEAAFANFLDSFNRLEWERFRATLATEVTLFNPDIPDATSLHRLDGRDLVEANFRSVFEAARRAGSGPHIIPAHVSIQSLGNAAVVTFEFERQAGSFGRRTLVFAQQGAGWKIIHIHASNVIPSAHGV
jgi:ketosteroid isomerase-like protein